MPGKFICEPIKNERRPGVLESVGMRWTENTWRQTGLNMAMGIVVIFFALLFVIVGIALIMSNGFEGIGIMFLIMAGGVLLFFVVMLFGRLPERVLIFERSGEISTPNGIPGKRALRTLDIKLKDVGRIEAGSTRSGAYASQTVQITTPGGKTIVVGQGLQPEEVREITVNLTMAKDAMRKNMQAETVQAPTNPFEPSSMPVKDDGDMID